MCRRLVQSGTIKTPKVFVSTNQQRFRKKVQPRFVVMAYIATRHAFLISVRTTMALSSYCLALPSIQSLHPLHPATVLQMVAF